MSQQQTNRLARDWTCPLEQRADGFLCGHNGTNWWPSVNRHLKECHNNAEAKQMMKDGTPIILTIHNGKVIHEHADEEGGDGEEPVETDETLTETPEKEEEEEEEEPAEEPESAHPPTSPLSSPMDEDDVMVVDKDTFQDEVLKVVHDAFGKGANNLDLQMVREIAWNTAKEVVTSKRRRVLQDMGMALMEGRVDKHENGQGEIVLKVDHTRVEELLGHYFDEGDEVRVLCQLVNENEELDDAYEEQSTCALCGKIKDNRRKPYCNSCWSG